MPRREYLRHHRHDINGNYAGTEPQQNWSDDMIKSHYGRYQYTSMNAHIPERGDADIVDGQW
jgi:hypothetical protein